MAYGSDFENLERRKAHVGSTPTPSAQKPEACSCQIIDKQILSLDMRETKEALLLDLDGCLLNSLWLWFRECKRALIDAGLHVPDEQIIHVLMPSLGDIVKFHHPNPGAFIADVIKGTGDNIHQTVLHKNVAHVLDALCAQGLPHAVVSSSLLEHILSALRANGYDHGRFGAIVARDHVKHTKPNKEPILKALNILGCNPGDARIIGDSRADMEGGTNALLKERILFYPPENEEFYTLKTIQSWKPDRIIRDFDEVLDVVGIRTRS